MGTNKFHVIVTNKVKIGKHKPGELREEFRQRAESRRRTFTDAIMWSIAAERRRN